MYAYTYGAVLSMYASSVHSRLPVHTCCPVYSIRLKIKKKIGRLGLELQPNRLQCKHATHSATELIAVTTILHSF